MSWEGYARRVLLCVTGLSPQVVTETLYALAIEAPPEERFVPTEIVVVTTSEGAERIRLQLLSKEPGWLHRLRADYGLPAIRFDEGSIRVLRDEDGRPIDDIRDPAASEAVADLILDAVRELTADPGCAVHASMAGGRKTMSYYLGYAMSLCGRPQDRLSHVLVDPPFEGHPDFFYPAPRQRVIFAVGDQRPLDASKARVTLADIPFVPMRHAVEAGLDHRRGVRFRDLVALARRAVGPPELVLDLPGRRVRAGGVEVRLSPSLLALYAVFARRAKRGKEPLAAPPKEVGDPRWAERYLDEYRRIVGELGVRDATERALRDGMDGQRFSYLKPKLHKALRHALGHAAEPYLIRASGRPRRFWLDLPPDAIRFETLKEDA